MPYDDNTLMPFGKYKGEPLIDVPASYLMWLYDTTSDPKTQGGYDYKPIREYIEDNMDVIKDQIKKQKR